MAQRVKVRFHTRTSAFFFWLMTLAGLALLFLVATLPPLSRNHAMGRELRRLEEENSRLAERVEQLRLEEEALRSDPTYNEAIARRELGLIKPRERVAWTPPASLRQPDQLAVGSQADVPVGEPEPVWSWTSQLGVPGTYLAQAFDRLSTDAAARKDGILLAMGMLSAAFLLFGRQEGTSQVRRSRTVVRRRV